MLILGIDPGSQILGYALLQVDGSQCRIIEMDVLYLKRTAEFDKRIEHIFHSVNDIIESRHPDLMAIEAPFLGKNAQSMLKLGRAQGIAIAAALAHNIPYTEYEPALIKRTVTGNGNASKEQVAATLDSILNTNPQNSTFNIRTPHYLDASDALAVAYTKYIELSGIGSLVSPKPIGKHKKSAKKQWAEFILENPERLS